MEPLKHILLVSYVFPPYYGIGGRRWAKHASELTKLGYVVHVICARNAFDEKSLWWDLVKDNPNIRIYQLPRRYPKVLVKFDHHFLQKILYKFWITVLPFLTKGSYLDRTIFWEKVMLRKARKLITEYSINHVICTGAPFGAMYQVTKLRKWFHDIFIMNDLRDPWTWGPNWGFANLPAERMKHELELELKVIEDSDIISMPGEEIKKHLWQKYPLHRNKFRIIPHFFDEEELCIKEKSKSETIRLIMYGNIYHGIENLIEKTSEILAQHKGRITLDVFTDKKKHEQVFREMGADNVRFFDQIPARDLFRKFSEYDYVLLIHPHYGINNISTKFFEIIYTRTPIILLCDDGLGPTFLRDNGLGVHANINTAYDLFDKLANNNLDFRYNHSYDISEYSLRNIARNISSLLDASAGYETIKPGEKIRKKILLTFDYELFLGKRSGTVANCIIIPTNIIINLLEKHKITKAIFFIDTTYIKRLLELNTPEAQRDYEKIEEQLCLLLQKGHLLFPHLHPHWIDALYLPDINQWDLKDTSRYRFHNIDPATKAELFDYSLSFIKKLQEKTKIHYPISGYRAGGWCLQPFSDFKPFFEKHNIHSDFSVLRNFSMFSEDVYYNYTGIPRKVIYSFEDNVETETPDGRFKEYSISYLEPKNNYLNKILLKYLSLVGIKNYGDGLASLKSEERTINETDNKIARQAENNYEMISIELLRLTKLKAYKKLIHDNSYTHFISHPKMLSSHNIRYFDKLLKHIQKHYQIETDFEKMN